jgi:hypothetical protein
MATDRSGELAPMEPARSGNGPRGNRSGTAGLFDPVADPNPLSPPALYDEALIANVDRAVLDGEEGFVKIHVGKGTDKILGATIVAEHAGDMIGEVTLAMVAGVGLSRPAEVIHPYPTRAEAVRKAADAYNRTRLTPWVKKLLSLWFSFTR